MHIFLSTYVYVYVPPQDRRGPRLADHPGLPPPDHGVVPHLPTHGHPYAHRPDSYPIA